MQHEAGDVLLRLHFPQLFQSDAVNLRTAIDAQLEAFLEHPPQMPAASFGEHGVFRGELDPGLVACRAFAIPADAHVARRDAAYAPILAVKDFGGGEARIDPHAERLGFPREAATEIADARR